MARQDNEVDVLPSGIPDDLEVAPAAQYLVRTQAGTKNGVDYGRPEKTPVRPARSTRSSIALTSVE